MESFRFTLRDDAGFWQPFSEQTFRFLWGGSNSVLVWLWQTVKLLWGSLSVISTGVSCLMRTVLNRSSCNYSTLPLTNFFILMQHKRLPCLYKFWKISKSDFVSIFYCISCADIMTFKSYCWGYYQICPPTTHAQLPGEYRREAAKVDQELVFMNGDGPTLRKLQRYPPVIDFCFGAYGECSDGVKSYLDFLSLWT